MDAIKNPYQMLEEAERNYKNTKGISLKDFVAKELGKSKQRQFERWRQLKKLMYNDKTDGINSIESIYNELLSDKKVQIKYYIKEVTTNDVKVRTSRETSNLRYIVDTLAKNINYFETKDDSIISEDPIKLKMNNINKILTELVNNKEINKEDVVMIEKLVMDKEYREYVRSAINQDLDPYSLEQ